MTDEKKSQSKSTTTTTERTEASSEELELLSPIEEKVVRMRHGLAEGDDHKLKFGLGADDETLAKLANLEMFLLERLGEVRRIEGVFDGADANSDSETKQKIIDALRDKNKE